MKVTILNTESEVTKELEASLKKYGIDYTIDQNPSPEKIERIKAIVELKRKQREEVENKWKPKN